MSKREIIFLAKPPNTIELCPLVLVKIPQNLTPPLKKRKPSIYITNGVDYKLFQE